MRHFAGRTTVALGAVLLVGSMAAAADDLTITSKVTSGTSAPTTSTQYFGATRLRTSNGTSDTIFDVSSGQITFVDHKDKSYWQTSQAEMMAGFKAMDEQMKGAMGAMMEKMMGGNPPVVVTKGTQPRTIAGYPTEHWVVTSGDWKYEVWTTPDLALPTQYYDAMKTTGMAMGPLGKRLVALFEEMKKIKGFPLATSTSMKIMGKTQASTTEATEVKKGAIPASAFEVPAGYKKKDSPMKSMQKDTPKAS
jgi:hypothetical protein